MELIDSVCLQCGWVTSALENESQRKLQQSQSSLDILQEVNCHILLRGIYSLDNQRHRQLQTS